jgi:hypothetical protein
MTKNAFATALLVLCCGCVASGQALAGPATLSVTAVSTGNETSGFATNDGDAMIAAGFANSNLTFDFGTLNATGPGTVTYTFLGSGAGDTNTFNLSDSLGANTVFDGKTSSLYSFSQQVTGAGPLDFSFQTIAGGNSPYVVSNGENLTTSACCGAGEGVFGIVTTPTTLVSGADKGASFQYLLIYNDPVNAGDYDFNDMVVGVNFTSPVPEPETYAMLMAGLGILGAVARRRKVRQV